MNENELKKLMTTYGDSFAPCEIPSRPRKVIRWSRGIAAGIAVTSAVALAMIGFWPRNAVASTVAKIHQALSDVKTMECLTSSKLPSGWHPILRIYYSNGMWQIDGQLNTNIERSFVMRNGQSLLNYRLDDFATLESADSRTLSEFGPTGQTALDFAKKNIDSGDVNIQRSVSIKDHAPVNGVPAYVVSFVRPRDNYHAEILVDKNTNLPIQSDLEAADERPGFEGTKQRLHTEFRFNKTLDPGLFSLSPDKTVIHVDQSRKTVSQRWLNPATTVDTTVEGSNIPELTVSPSGTIWLVTIVKQNQPYQAEMTLPTTLTDEHHNQYVPLIDQIPDLGSGNPDPNLILGKYVYLIGFTPLRPTNVIPETVTIGFGKRQLYYGSNSKVKVTDLHKSVTLHPHPTDTSLPSFFSLLGMSPQRIQIDQMVWSARAKALDAKGDLADAALAYEEWAKASYKWVKYSAFKPMLDAAKCYRSLGQTERADELTRQAEALKASRER